MICQQGNYRFVVKMFMRSSKAGRKTLKFPEKEICCIHTILCSPDVVLCLYSYIPVMK